MTTRIDPDSIPEFPDLSIEQAFWQTGLTRLAGIDEAGRGAWAGPVSAGVVILPADLQLVEKLRGVRDSKQMTPQQRKGWAPRIQQACLDWAVGFASAEEIDAIGILPATRLAVTRAIRSLSMPPDHLITDYLLLPELSTPQTSLIKGDQRSLSVAAASVLAKTSRDALMQQLGPEFSQYGFANHKGYGTRQHQEAIHLHGMSAIHRRSFDLLKYQPTPK